MSDYTAADFAQAMFARHGGGGRAARFDGDKWPWRASPADAIPWLSDEEMARDGWVPIVEDSETIRDLRHDLALARKERERFAHDLRRLYGQPKGDNAITLDALEAAWEAAEQASECRKGDVLIMQDPAEGYSVWRTGDADYLSSGTRILSRAPREPWQDLADALRGTVWERLSGDVDGLAEAVHAAGWRKGGEEE